MVTARPFRRLVRRLIRLLVLVLVLVAIRRLVGVWASSVAMP